MTHAEAAVALVTAHLGKLPRDVIDAILADADTADVADLLAGVMAFMIGTTDGGPAWFQQYALSVAEGRRDA